MEQDYILHKYLNGEASPEEVAALRASGEYAQLLEIATASAEFELPEFDREKNYGQIVQKRTPRVYRRPKALRYITQIAAVAVILVAGLLFLNNREQLVTTDIAQQQTVSLPDGSQVKLNANSSIRYNKRSWSDDRALTLEGEAFFKVEKGQKFEVQTDKGVVAVLGTQFNVFARDSLLDVVCYEGLVRVEASGRSAELSPGKALRISSGRWNPISVTDERTPGWLLGESSYHNTKLSVVLAELQNYYDVSIDLGAPDLGLMSFTGNFPHDDLQVALRSICEPLKLKFEITDKQIRIYAP